jgi:glycosyltransferase involved in cell wall biosynthesis
MLKLFVVDDLNKNSKDRDKKITILNYAVIRFAKCEVYKDPTITKLHGICENYKHLESRISEFHILKLSSDIVISDINNTDTVLKIKTLKSEIDFLTLNKEDGFQILRIPEHVNVNIDLIYEYLIRDPLIHGHRHNCQCLRHNESLISAIMVTKNRVNYVKNAVESFIKQTYISKELIIVTDNDEETEKYGKELERKYKNIRVYNYIGKLTLGELRNIGIKHAYGEYIIQWDDDDYYHPARIGVMYSQLKSIPGSKFAIMKNWTVAWPQYNKVGISKTRLWEGSILFDRDLYPKHQYSEESKDEDRKFVMSLLNSKVKYITLDSSYAPIYVYGIHGKNTWDNNHLRGIMNSCIKDLTDTNKICSSLLPYVIDANMNTDYDTDDPGYNPNVFLAFLIAIIIIACILIGYLWYPCY